MLIKKLMITGLVAFLAASVGILTLLLTQSAPQRPPAEKPLPEAVIVFCFRGKDAPEKETKERPATSAALGAASDENTAKVPATIAPKDQTKGTAKGTVKDAAKDAAKDTANGTAKDTVKGTAKDTGKHAAKDDTVKGMTKDKAKHAAKDTAKDAEKKTAAKKPPKDLAAQAEKIETYTKEVVEKYFADAVKDGSLVWQVLDYQSPKNASLVRDFAVKKTCIVVGDARPTGSGMATNLEKKVWELVDNKEEFQKYVRSFIQKTLKPELEAESEEGVQILTLEEEEKIPQTKPDAQTSDSKKEDPKKSDLKKDEPTNFPKMGSEAPAFDPDVPTLPHEPPKQEPKTEKKQSSTSDAAKESPASKEPSKNSVK